MHAAFDLESYPNCFTMAVMPIYTDGWWCYEISHRRNDAEYLYRDIKNGMFTRLYGFNNMSYDYPLLHYIMDIFDKWGPSGISGPQLADLAYRRTLELIATEWGKGWQNHIWPREQRAQQVDLLLLNHFDNKNKITSLKDLMFNLRCPNMRELPFVPGTVLTDEQIDTLIDYNVHSDTWTTHRFTHECLDAVKFREDLMADGTFGPECLNWNDVKIGEKIFIQRLEEAKPGVTAKVNGHKPQTHRRTIAVADIIVPYVHFERPELRQLLANLRDTVVDGTQLKGSYNFKVPLDDVVISIGAGGIHGSLNRQVIHANAERIIIDIDVTGYYPSVAIENELYPEHIGPVFSRVYRTVRDDRNKFKKAGIVSKAGGLKLANNGAFGKTNDFHSVLLDPKCMLAITVNGQLLQCVLAEAVLRIPGARILQLNTDGITVEIPRHMRAMFDEVCTWWQRYTCLDLEFTDYQAMWLRDCNNYLARDVKGKMKRKGDYDHEMLSGSIGGQKAHNRDFSALVVPKAVEAAFVRDEDPADFIEHHSDAYDFLIKMRTKDGGRLVGGHSGRMYGKLARYYIATDGEPLVKVMRPLAGKTEDRRIGIHAEGRAVAHGTRKNYTCSMCGQRFTHKTLFDDHNKAMHAWPVRMKMDWDGDLSGLDRRWYVQEAEKLLF